MADDVNTLAVAAVGLLQYFVILVACQMLLIRALILF